MLSRQLGVALLVFGGAMPPRRLHAQPSPDVFELPIAFRTPTGTRSASPVLRLRIGGKDVAMLLDNNVTHEMFTARFARSMALRVKGRIVGTRDHAGRPMEAHRLHDVDVGIGGRTVRLRHAGAFRMDPSFEADGLVGILPLDALVDTGYVLLAPRSGRLLVVRGSEHGSRRRAHATGPSRRYRRDAIPPAPST